MNGQFNIAVHVLTLLNKAGDELLSSEYIAASINMNPALLRKEISNLRKQGLVTSKEGKNGGYSLGKPAQLIKLSDVYMAIKHQPVLGYAKNMPHPDCPVGKQINKHIDSLYKEMENTLLNKLGTVTLAEFGKKFD